MTRKKTAQVSIKNKFFTINVKIKEFIKNLRLKIVPPQEVKCPEGYKLIITEDGFAACAKEK